MMIYGLFIFLIILYAACNVLRGSGKVKKVLVYAGFSLIYSLSIYSLNPSIGLGLLSIFAVTSFAVDWICNSWGWGDFFPHGRVSRTGDFKPAAWCADKFYSIVNDTVKWQTTAMSFRFFLTFGLIGTSLLSYAVSNWWYLCTAPLLMLSGPAYRLCFIKETRESIPASEFVNGLLLGTVRGTLLFIVA